MSLRTDKVGSVIKRIVSQELLRRLPNTFLAVTEVKVSADLKHATLWVNSFNPNAIHPEQIQNLLDEHRPQLQARVADQLRSKFTPRLVLKVDKGYSHEQSLEQIDPS